MKVSDYIVSFLVQKNIKDLFGYPGGMVTHLMDSLDKYSLEISAHINYHEQGAAMSACGYAQTSLNLGVAYATSGPGATNLITGVANAYFDSIPTMFLTGQVNTYESKGDLSVRQKGFQEMNIIEIVKGITKYCTLVEDAQDIRYQLEKAYYFATNGRPGSVLLDIPMNVQRAEIDTSTLRGFLIPQKPQYNYEDICEKIINAIEHSERPCILAGAGINSSGMGKVFSRIINELKIPVVSSMLAVDILPESTHYYGFIGAYGDRSANFILAKSDLIISLGSRMDIRQTGANTNNFAVNAKLIRIDFDLNELTNKIKPDEIQIEADLKTLLPMLERKLMNSVENNSFSDWLSVCKEIKQRLENVDNCSINSLISSLSKEIDKDVIITTDVGQNQVWIAQSFKAKYGQRILFSGGHGAMGYSLPAAIGAYYGSGGKKVISFNGDGGIQMNIQELQLVVRENLPIKIIVFNNQSLGMIRHFQEMYFDSNYVQTKKDKGYTVPNFSALAKAYGLPYDSISVVEDLIKVRSLLKNDKPAFIEIFLEEDTYVFPKLAINKPNQDQEPELDRGLYSYISEL